MTHFVIVRISVGHSAPVPRVAVVVGEEGALLTVRLWQRMTRNPAKRWARHVRVARSSDVARDATEREALVGMPIGPLPPRFLTA